MADYAITGFLKNSDQVITHYILHTLTTEIVILKHAGEKRTMAEVLKLVENPANNVVTMSWDYKEGEWQIGEQVDIVKKGNEKYLRTHPDNRLTNNLGHLIDFGLLEGAFI